MDEPALFTKLSQVASLTLLIISSIVTDVQPCGGELKYRKYGVLPSGMVHLHRTSGRTK